jgi:protein-tyrosine phosphatase
MAKTDYIMNNVNPKLNYSVPDPYYGNKDGFELVYRLLDAACDKIIETIV